MPNQKRVFLIHGWGGRPGGGFQSWLKKELEARGFFVGMPAMPKADKPKIEEWLAHLQSTIKNPDENTILVGHSLGGQAVLRYLAELPKGIQIKKAVLVAPVVEEIKNLDLEEQKISGLWLKTPINEKRAKKAAKEIVAFFSEDDPWIPLSSEKVLREKFEARTIVERKRGHYTNNEPMPQILEEIVGFELKNKSSKRSNRKKAGKL